LRNKNNSNILTIWRKMHLCLRIGRKERFNCLKRQMIRIKGQMFTKSSSNKTIAPIIR
jgi:hypothetical protein